MKVSDVMHKALITVTPETPVSEIIRIIFSLGISGTPVVEGKKMLGIVTEEDILSRLYPSMREFVEDYLDARNFNSMEKRLTELMSKPAREIMNKKMTNVTQDTPLLRAQSMMLTHNFSRLPVVNDKNELVGIVSQGDVFRELMKKEIPQIEQERYAGFVAEYYDLMVDWGKRLKFEFPVLLDLFKRHGIDKVVDLGAWTGEYAIQLAKRGIHVTGVDNSHMMIKMCMDKKENLPKREQKNVDFVLSDYSDVSQKIKEQQDAIICMGNSLPYIYTPFKKLFRQLHDVLREDGVICFQLLNFDKILEKKNRLLSFNIVKSPTTFSRSSEHLFIEFFDEKTEKWLNHNVIIFDSDGTNWVFKGITTVPVRQVNPLLLRKRLAETGFRNIKFTGNLGQIHGEYGPLSFDELFDPKEHEWLNVVATK